MTKKETAKKAKRVRVSMTLPDGSRKFFSGKTKREAEKKRDEAKVLMAGGWSVGNKTTFEQMADLWLEEYKAQKKQSNMMTLLEIMVLMLFVII